MSQPDQASLKARSKLLALFVVLCTLDTTLVIIAQDKWAIGRILLTIVVMHFVLQRRKWAKWLLMGICSLQAVILVIMVLALSSKLSPVIIAGSLLMAVLCAIIPIYMVSSKDLNRYLSWGRQN